MSKIKSIKELIDLAEEQEADRQQAAMMAEEAENKQYDLGWCYRRMKAWRSWYFRTNSKFPASIRVTCSSLLAGGILYNKFSLQLFRNGKLEEDMRIREEAFDVITRDIKSEVMPGNLEIWVLQKHQPKVK